MVIKEGEFEIKIDKRLDDKTFMEHCLNLKASGYDPLLFIVLFATGRRWKIDKFTRLLEILYSVDCGDKDEHNETKS